MKPKVYLAGPITGASYKTATSWRDDVALRLSDNGIDAYSPLRGKTYLKHEKNISDSYENTLTSSQRGIFARDSYDCMNCDAIFVNLLGTEKVSIGTVMEIAWGWAFRKPIILVMEKTNNLQDHSMIREACPFITDDLESAILLTTSLLLPVGH